MNENSNQTTESSFVLNNGNINQRFDIKREALASSGTCGSSCNWNFDSSTGLFTVTGSGVMNEVGYSFAPWHGIKGEIKKVIIGEGITVIGSHTFSRCYNLKTVILPSTLVEIQTVAFWSSSSLNAVYFYGTKGPIVGDRAFLHTSLNSVNVPSAYNSETFGTFKVTRPKRTPLNTPFRTISNTPFRTLYNTPQQTLRRTPMCTHVPMPKTSLLERHFLQIRKRGTSTKFVGSLDITI